MQIVYLFYSRHGRAQGGHKMILRHVETLRDLGFDAVAYTGATNALPTWFQHRAPIVIEKEINPATHTVVVPDDAMESLGYLSERTYASYVLVQGHFNFAAASMDAVDRFRPEHFPEFFAVSPSVKALVERVYPAAKIHLIPAFADERLFKPGPPRDDAVALISRKRPLEAAAIRNLFPRLHPEHANLRWRWIEDADEADVASAMARSTIFLSLSRLEGLGLTPLEAMAAGCVVAGFTGVGGRDFATPENGFWVPEDDCEAAVEAVAQAADLVKAGGRALNRRLDAGYETARQWSYAAFRERLEALWMQLAPAARIRNGPLD